MLSPQIEMFLQSRLGKLLELGMDEQQALAFVEEMFKAGWGYAKQQVKELKLEGAQEE